ncbi:hypothetical protein ACOMHN_066231 [Nucella lapillus]
MSTMTSQTSPLSQAALSTQQLTVVTSSSEDMSGGEGGGGLMSADVLWKSFSVMDHVLYVLEGFNIYLPFQVVGLILNALNIAVMTRPSMRSPTSAFLVSLSVLQFVYITIRFIAAVYGIFNPVGFTDFFFLVNNIYINNYVLTSLRRAMYCLQCFISAERLLAVWLPLKAKQFLLVRRPWLFICLTPVVVFLAHLHVALKIEIFETRNERNQTVHSFRYSQHYQRDPEAFNQLSIAMKVVFVYLTLLMLIVTNLAMIHIIKRSASARKKMNTNVDMSAAQKRENQMTLTIVVSTVIFVVLCLPTVSSSLAANAAPHSYGPFSPHRHLYLFLNRFGGLLFVLAFSTDFFTYVSLSTTYRNTLLRMLKMKNDRKSFSSVEAGTKTSVISSLS